MKMVNVASTCYSTTRRAVTSLLEGDSALSVMSGWITGIAFGAIIGVVMGIACDVPKTFITIISVMATILLAPQMIEDWENGDYDLAVAGGLQMLSSLSAIFMKCFTGDTLVATEDGDKRIDEICVGDSVWAEDTVTGERTLKLVSKVYVKETDHLVHIGTSTGEDIETTENHPFYVDGRGWVAASELEEGETLHTEDGSVIVVTYNRDEWLKEPVKVYNLEVEGLHTYYVTVDRVLVHNEYSKTKWGPEHGTGNTKHNNAIENELDSAFEQGATDIAKNKAQRDINGNRVYSSDGSYIKPDASYTMNGKRYNINFVSNYLLDNKSELNRELEALLKMIEADPEAICRLIFKY